MKQSNLFKEFKNLNPWPVLFEDTANARLEAMLMAEEEKKEKGTSQRLIIDLISKATTALKTFPPDDSIFTDPMPSLDNLHIWLVVTLGHKKILLKAQYRLDEKVCAVTDIGVKGT